MSKVPRPWVATSKLFIPAMASPRSNVQRVPMRILMHSEFDLTVSDFHSSEFEVDVDPHAHAHFSALQMFATSLALCTASVLADYGEQLGAETHALQIRLRWEVEERPRRISHIEMDIEWPGLPTSRLAAAKRAAAHCTLHNTLHHSTKVETRVTAPEQPGQAEGARVE